VPVLRLYPTLALPTQLNPILVDQESTIKIAIKLYLREIEAPANEA
jgi:hypothetical protein